jgi:phenylacetate-coenzyme A ligase PaaK-like adenylate-forming protein
MWASFITANKALEQIGVHTLPIGGHISVENIVSYLKAFASVGKLDGVVSIPSVLLGIAQYVEKNKVEGLRLRKIGYGGEHLAPAAKDYLRKVLQAEIIGSCSYAINDTGVVGYQCGSCTGTLHHVEEDLHLVEILDAETLKPVPPGHEGIVVVTNLDRTLMPVIRYAVGDRARFVPEPCACGRKTPRFELLGRADEVVIVGADNVSIDTMAGIVAQVPGLSQNFTLTGRTVEGRDRLDVRVETLEAVAPEKAQHMAQRLLETILQERVVIATGVQSGAVEKPAVEVVAPGALPRNPKTGKIKRVYDERHP